MSEAKKSGVRSPESGGKKAPRWAWQVATGFGSGRIKGAPGTWGSIAALLAWMLTSLPPMVLLIRAYSLGKMPDGMRLPFELLVQGFALVLCALMAQWAVRASDLVVAETGEKDPGYIVADEWAGMWIAMWGLRWAAANSVLRVMQPGPLGWKAWFLLSVPFWLGFALFRLFDIWKPWPCKQVQALPGGEGVVVDDVVAGLYAAVLGPFLFPYLVRALERVLS